MAALRVHRALWTLVLLTALCAPQRSAAQAAPDGLGEARGCTRSRIGVTGSIVPVTAASHTFLGRFVGSFSRYVQPSLRDVHGTIAVGLGGPAPTSVAFAMKRPLAQPVVAEQTEDRLAPEQHRALFTGIKSALAEIQGVSETPYTITLRLEGRC